MAFLSSGQSSTFQAVTGQHQQPTVQQQQQQNLGPELRKVR